MSAISKSIQTLREDLLEAVLEDGATLDPRVKELWLKALRSGEYKQGRDTLCRVGEDGVYSFCCFGVLANEDIDAYWHPDAFGERHHLGPSGQEGVLTDTYLKRIRLSDEAHDALTRANDDGVRFSSIAKAIEECL